MRRMAAALHWPTCAAFAPSRSPRSLSQLPADGGHDLDLDIAARAKPRLRDHAGTGRHVAGAGRHGATALSARAGGTPRGCRAGHAAATPYLLADRAGWPAEALAFWETGETERFSLSWTCGDHLDLTRRGAQAWTSIAATSAGCACRPCRTTSPGPQLLASPEGRDLQRAFTLTLLLPVAAVWLASLVPGPFLAHRVSHPMRQLTAGLTGFAAGYWDCRLAPGRNDEVGRAVTAFNHMADQLRRGRERLVNLTQCPAGRR